MFPFIYEPNKSICVFEKTTEYLDNNIEVKDKILNLSMIYHSIGDLIPHTIESFWSGHYFPFTESWDEIQISFTLCQFGLYKQAMTSLRSGLELGILSVYYNINDEGHKTVKKWITSHNCREANTPRSNQIWNILESHPNIREFQRQINIEEQYLSLGYLHNYVHTKGYKFSNDLGLLKSNFQTFQVEGLLKWLETYESIVILVSTLHLLKYPIGMVKYDYSRKFGIDIPSFSQLNPAQIERIEEILPKGYFENLKKISEKDEETKHFIEWVESLHDMTEKDVDEQIIRMDKSWIERQGIDDWIKNELTSYRCNKIEDLPPKILDKVKALKEWAIENNYIDFKKK